MWLLQGCLLVQVLAGRAAYYHELSMTTIEPAANLTEDAFFGYSIAFQNNSIIASAPNADSDGKVFVCDLTTKNCSQIPIKIGGKKVRKEHICHDKETYKVCRNGEYVTHTHNFWLGANVKADTENVIVCAPRVYDNFTVIYYNKLKNETRPLSAIYGRCYAKRLSGSTFTELTQVSTEDRNLHDDWEALENLFDTLGWSIDIDTKRTLRVGSPVLDRGRLVTYDDVWQKTTPPLTLSPEKGYNFGYSIATGYFINSPINGNKLGVAVGSPYGIDGTGKVYIYNEQMKLEQATVKDPWGVGSMFSAALCAAQLGDESTSLLVGAPAHFSGKSYHTGIVYVYKQVNWEYSITKVQEIPGPRKDGAFFGYAIANVGDLDHDKKDEIAIAAPYEDEGRGAVYLYAGDALGRDEEPSWLQRFHPEARGFRNLGVSVVGNKYFGETCNDLAIGAPGSNKVAVYHCLTVITVTVNAKKPDLQNRTDMSQFAFDLCLNATYPPKPENIEAGFNVTVKITHPNAMLADAINGNNYIEYKKTLYKHINTDGCQKINVTTIENGDYDQEIQFNITAKLLDDPRTSTVFDPSRATLSSHSKLTPPPFTVSAAKCIKTPCKPDLTVELTTSIADLSYLIGSSKIEKVNVVVHNAGDTAYRPCLRVRAIGAGVRRAPPNCTVVDGSHRSCRLLGPLHQNGTWNVTEHEAIELDLSLLKSDDTEIRVTAEVYNRCELGKDRDAEDSIKIKLTTGVSELKVLSKTDEGEEVPINKDDNVNGMMLHHTYMITNAGEINWVSIHCFIWMHQSPYIAYNDNIQIYIGDTPRKPCNITEHTITNASFLGPSCELGGLMPKQTITVVIPITVLPGALEKVLKKSNATVSTVLRVIAGGQDLEKEELTTLKPQETTAVPTWISAVATAVGVGILSLLAFALYECGFLRRKKKQQLVKLQRDVKRKSMMLQRQSMRLTESDRMQLRNLTYRELLDKAEKSEVEMAEEATEDILDQKVKRRTGLNGTSSVSNLDLRAQIEKALQNPNPMQRRKDKNTSTIYNESEI